MQESFTTNDQGRATMIRQSIVQTVFGFTALFSLSVSAQLTISPPNPAAKARIGIVLPKAQLQGETSEQAAEAVRELITSYLVGPVLEIVPLEARIPAQIDAEANGRNCTHVLYTSLEQEKRGAKGIFSKVAKKCRRAAQRPQARRAQRFHDRDRGNRQSAARSSRERRRPGTSSPCGIGYSTSAERRRRSRTRYLRRRRKTARIS